MELPGRLLLLGGHAERSLSPAMQNAALEAAGIPLRYEPCSVAPENLDHCVGQLRRMRAAGNVTIPHKERFAVLCDELTAVARRAGAVNTFWTRGATLVGDNTDVAGFQELARRTTGDPAGNSIVAVLGAGGAAAAVVLAVAEWPEAHIRIHARSPERARALTHRLGVPIEIAHDPASAVRGASVVVNATPIGSASDEHPVDLQLLAADAAVLDLVYRREETHWVRAARAAGHRAADGAAMLVEQGALAFERWFGQRPDRRKMWQALR